MRKAAALLRLAARAGTPAEAANAAAHAQAVMDRYQLTRDAVEIAGSQQPEKIEDFADFSDRDGGELLGYVRTDAWRVQLAGNLARLNGCFVFRSSRTVRNVEGKQEHRRSLEIVGRPSQVETTRYLNGWLAQEVGRMASDQGVGMGQVWRREFCEGAVSEIDAILRRQRAETIQQVRTEAKSETAIVLASVEHAIVRMQTGTAEAGKFAHAKHKLVNGSGGSRGRYDGGARAAGAAAARTINLSGAKGALPGRTRMLPGR